MTNSSMTYFRDVLNSLAADNKKSLSDVAREISYDKSMLSRVGEGDRNLSRRMAQGLSKALGGETNTWIRVFEETREGSDKSIVSYRREITGKAKSTENEASGEFAYAQCFDPFDPANVEGSTYDTTLGYIVSRDGKLHPIEHDGEGDENQSDEGETELLDLPAPVFSFQPMKPVLVATNEKLLVPSDVEGIASGTNLLARKHLRIEGGLFVHPGYCGHLIASVVNFDDSPVDVSTDEPFITVRLGPY